MLAVHIKGIRSKVFGSSHEVVGKPRGHVGEDPAEQTDGPPLDSPRKVAPLGRRSERRPRSPRSTRATAPRAAVHDGRPRSLRVRPRAADWRTQEQRLARPNAHLHSACFTLYIHKATITGVFFAVFLSTAAVWCVPFGLDCSVPSVPSCLLQVSPNSNNNTCCQGPQGSVEVLCFPWLRLSARTTCACAQSRTEQFWSIIIYIRESNSVTLSAIP